MLPTSTPKASPYMAFIDLGRKIYNPKDIVDGTVELTLDKKLNCDSITVKLFGSARVFFTELSAAQGQLGKTIGYKQEKILIEDKTEVWKCDARSSVRETSINDIVRMASSTSIMPKRVSPQESPGLEPGLHKFNFSFQLPESGLETSFDAQHAAGCVRYYIQVEATRDGYMTFRKKLLFPIVKPVDLSTSKAAMGGFGKEETFSTKKGSVTVALTLDKVGYVPGEPVTGMITIKNKTDKSVKYSHLCLMQRAFCYANYPEVKIKESFHHTAVQ
ncbi:hypothetical protein L596_006626 [Steinernema carpocapsae]|uniref:Arrestin-like N-terminal domain-containing protein n=1 Tax=Steinernema carpocapsae TaxID=34508 RepID=A0A4U8V5G5_STECR|nr:hypothetical protein L596_006626 [Steinernema carpocapsae]